ncbi:class II glutamine amidotransferase [Candidatus Woesearchaeota archaeon]|nr:class II glutamine amidotransferase [Candidatus Woesearchaeota archaeon]
MCGIIGMISNGKSVSREVVQGLVALQHRGRDSSGIITTNWNGSEFGSIIRGVGPAKEVFKDVNLDEIVARAAIGHDRYSTIGSNLSGDAQPLYKSKTGTAIAHNGHIANYLKLKEELKQRKSYHLATQCDAEALLCALVQNMIDLKSYEAVDTPQFVNEKFFPAVRAILDHGAKYGVTGAYSVIGLSIGHGIFALKDPHGTRPLIFAQRREQRKLRERGELIEKIEQEKLIEGREQRELVGQRDRKKLTGQREGRELIERINEREDDDEVIYAFASESIALPKLRGFDKYEELGPGEAVFIDFNMNVYKQTIFSLGQKICKFEPVYFAKGVSYFNGKVIEDIRYELGLEAADEFSYLKDRIDNILAVPKTAIRAAEAVAKAWDKPFGGIEAADDGIRSFLGGTQTERNLIAYFKFSYNPHRIEGKSVGVIDDSVVRGTISKSLVRALYELGAKEVHFISVYPPFIGICAGGIDVPEEKELLLNENTPEAIEIARQTINATTLNYLSRDRLLKTLGLTEDTVCSGCTKKEYPFDLGDYYRFQEQRRSERLEMERLIS